MTGRGKTWTKYSSGRATLSRDNRKGSALRGESLGDIVGTKKARIGVKHLLLQPGALAARADMEEWNRMWHENLVAKVWVGFETSRFLESAVKTDRLLLTESFYG